MIYLIILILLILLSFHYDINGKTKYRDQWYCVIFVIFVLLVGLRWRVGADTPIYINYFYHEYPTLDEFSFKDYYIGRDPFYVLINTIVKTLGGRFYIVQLIVAAFVNALVFKYIKKHTSYLFTCLFFYYIFAFRSLNTEIMRGSMSIVICMFANDYFLKKDIVKGYLLYFIALMFHVQTIVMFFMPFLLFMKANAKGLIVILVAFFIGFVALDYIKDYVLLFEGNEAIQDKAISYANSDIYGVGSINFKGAVVNLFLIGFYPLLSLRLLKRNHNKMNLQKMEPLIMITILFFVIQLNIQIFYRYVEYYRIYIILFYAELFVYLINKSKATVSLALACFMCFVLYSPILYFTTQGLLNERYRFLPYTSILNREIIHEREIYYNSISYHPRANVNEY